MSSHPQHLSPPSAAYIHIPFCRRRCYYCDFPVSIVGDRVMGEQSGTIVEYVAQLCQEITTSSASSTRLNTVFFGGGTPSLLAANQVKEILATLNRQFGIASNAEISMEIDPGTFSLEQLQGYAQAGVNRISFGVQAFQDDLLKRCGRSHNVADIFASVELIRQVGIPNFSLDLISGLPYQTLQQWQYSLETAISLAPQHISCYDLVLESVTAFGKQYQPGETPLPDDETTAAMYRLAQQTLTQAGYQHYEISNYAKPGYQCRHNRVYWQNQSYYGFGMGAASYTHRQRFTRPRTRQAYYDWVSQGCKIDEPPLSETDRLLETLMLGLRLAEGVDLANLTQQFGEAILKPLWTCLQPYYHQGWVEATSQTGEILTHLNSIPLQGKIRLQDPQGFLFSNTILADIFNQF
ncbi:radical SAM family heme chaperone HemW [Kamptonema cortianum]|uniref:Heme chaperone HemW n=1 Tax=Geitlerinema calcuttense NRMC-F 0142 TaxID=2922238 RepID=A0ABT7LXT6_9CYAN|nr:radical SAM family heme chaperone HemW [Geitlerinema calcuttense]MDK3159305.1 radical SAM family heme chaperone HemW [Kamptonema cortianum]MDL5056813.1 radical SAM family heme chaperone HemW [Geitlerinema calcuttense NRMC-F 0142]